jgi:hypothetical protein
MLLLSDLAARRDAGIAIKAFGSSTNKRRSEFDPFIALDLR